MQFNENMRLGRGHKKKKIRWSKIIWVTFAVVVVLGLIVTGYTYWAIAPMRSAENRVERLVHQKTDLVNLDQITVDYRDKTTYAVIGEDAKGTKQVAIIQGNSEKVKTFPRSSGMTNQELDQLVVQRYHPKRLYSANISYFKDTLVWEVSYEGRKGELNYVTLDFKTGKAYRTINGL